MRVKIVKLPMRIGVTTLFKGSAFSGALPQVALFIATALKDAGHDVVFMLPPDSSDWFIDCKGASDIPAVKLNEGAKISTFDLVVEVVWYLPAQMRIPIAKKSVIFHHYPSAFYDIECSVYPLATTIRDYTGISAIWTWSHFKETDYAYLEFISRKPVFKCPFFWNPMLLDSYIKECRLPEWSRGEEDKIVICESNQSNTSNCTMPMVILSEIYLKNQKQKWTVVNGDELIKRDFFVSNVVKNLHFGQGACDISGNFMKRVRLPDLRRESNYIISHQRFRPIKYMLLDALYLGIPLIHNCEMLSGLPGGQYFYTLNRIGQALSCWDKIREEERPNLDTVQKALLKKFGPKIGSKAMNDLIQKTFYHVSPTIKKSPDVRLAFFDMWVDFQPGCNLFLEAFAQNGHNVVNDQSNPTVIIFGPFGSVHKEQRWSSVPKIFYTGENIPPAANVALNIGFLRNQEGNYLRIPNWYLELNWYKQDAALIKNPQPFPLDMLKMDVNTRSKFCIFVASNPNSVKRNSLYHIVSRYKPIDSAGTLLNNSKQIPGGPGGSGGQTDKVESYKKYKFALVCENSETPGYVTEKLLHAKLGGCVPIYFGDPDVHLEFNKDSFINVRDYSSIDKLLSYISELDKDSAKWLNIATKPLLSDEAIKKAKDNLTRFTKIVMSIKVVPKVLESKIDKIASVIYTDKGQQQQQQQSKQSSGKIEPYPITAIKDAASQVIFTCCNRRFVDSTVLLIQSSKVPVYVWVWDMTSNDKTRLTEAGAKQLIDFETSWNPNWGDFWNPEHYAWKSLVLMLANSGLPKGTKALYLDSGIEVVGELKQVWEHIGKDGYFIIKEPQHKMKTWCHPTFCSLLNVTSEESEQPQISANVVGFVAGDEKMTAITNQALTAACNPDIIMGQKWHRYSEVCNGHRHDQSILSLMCHRNGIKMHLHDSYAGWRTRDECLKSDCVFWVHRGEGVANGQYGKATTTVYTKPKIIDEPVITFEPKVAKAVTTKINGVDEIYVVNLSHRTDRLEQFWSNQPYLKGVCKRLDAVNGRKIELDKEICHLFRNNDFKWKKSVMGCAMSHYEMWKQFAKQNEKLILVLEDDALLTADFTSKWNSTLDLMPKDVDFLYIGGVLPPNKPGLPMVTEAVNSAFARVRVNNMFGGTRRYFHFCTYSYFITSRGAQKMCKLIEERGIFTSADHMIVNHMDLFNVYFTTPLLAGCVQDNDPIYQNADFNNFNRIDKFDSEIWNNTEVFSPDEVKLVTAPAKPVTTLKMVYFQDKEIDQAINLDWLKELFQCEFSWVSAADRIEPGSKVMINYIQHTPGYVIEGWINRNSDCKLYLLHSDETCKGDILMYGHPAVRTVFRNYWRPECVGPKVVHIPLGYLNGKGGNGSNGQVVMSSVRPYNWSFAGAMDRNNRKAVIMDLQKRYKNNRIHLTPTFGSEANLGAEDYKEILQKSQFVPCLDGFFNTESFRFYEALESGALPVICVDEKKSYQNMLPGAPLLTVNSWSDEISFDWDTKQREMLQWWGKFKFDLKNTISAKMK